MSDSDQILVNLLEDASFVRWINGEADPQEQEKWDKWEHASTENADRKRQARILYNMTREINDGADIDKQLKRLHKRIDERDNVIKLSHKRNSNIKYPWAAAGVVALLISIVGFLTFYNYQKPQPQEKTSKPLYSTIEVGFGEKGALKISDGSTIQINANSSLRYSPEQFNTDTAEVWLKGEAFFDITHNPDNHRRTFIVHTTDGAIKVLGTRFNVNTRFNRTGVVLEKGSVEIVLSDTLQGNKGQIVIKPGQRAQFSSRKTDIQVQDVDTSLYTAWLDGKLNFKKITLRELTQNIEQTYGVSIQFQDSTIADQKISGSLRNPNLSTLLEGLEVILDLKVYQQTDNKYIISKPHPNRR